MVAMKRERERERNTKIFDKSVSPRYISSSDKISYRFAELDERIDEWTRGGGERVTTRFRYGSMKLLWGARFAFGGRGETPVRKLHGRREAGRVEATRLLYI